MFNAEFIVQALADIVQERVASRSVWHFQVDSQGDPRRAQRPYV